MRVALVQLDMAIDHGVKHRPRLRVERLLLDQNFRERLALVENPAVHRRDELVARDEVHLQSQDAEQEVAVGHKSPRRTSKGKHALHRAYSKTCGLQS